jgi:hypothetical protein
VAQAVVVAQVVERVSALVVAQVRAMVLAQAVVRA